jgi:hypothetical protein
MPEIRICGSISRSFIRLHDKVLSELNIGETFSVYLFTLECDYKLLSALPFISHGNPDNNLESHFTLLLEKTCTVAALIF